jgi:superfamily II DNA or RNA helicase/urease beta subunit
MRKLQKLGMEAIVENMKNWRTSWVIKLPTGTGKTRLFCELLRAIGKNGLILVPRVDLYDSTVRDLREVWFEEKDIHLLHEQEGWNTADKVMSLLTDPQIDWSSWKNQCIMTYQALTSLVKKNPEMAGFIQSHFDVVIEDEAHRWLWDKTKQAIGEIAHQSIDQVYDFSEWDYVWFGIEAEETEEISLEEEAERIISGIRYNYKFTATPDLLWKSVAEDGEYIYYATVEDAVRTGAIVLPQYIDVWAAYTKNTNLDGWKIYEIEKIAEWDNFVDESGKSIRDKVIDAYIEKKNEVWWVLPWVAFASTIKHAEDIVKAYEARWIRARRVTSDPSDISSKEATAMMDRWELDVIVTVTKVSEWFDYPPLACAMWFCPSLSPAKIFQGNGRIMRLTENKKPESVTDDEGKIVPSPGAFIIAPSVWYGGSSERSWVNNIDWVEEWTWTEDLLDEIPDEDYEKERKSTLPRIGNFYELLVDRWEFDVNALWWFLRDIINLDSSLRCEPGEEKEVDGVIYVGVTHNNEVMGMKWSAIFANLKKADSVKSINGRQKNGKSITLVPKSFIEWLMDTCEPGEEKEVDGVIYMGVTHKNEVMGMKWKTILRILKRTDSVKGINGRQKNGMSITLVPKSFIEGLLVDHTCEPGEEKEVDGVIYMGVTHKNEVMGMKWRNILRNLQETDEVKSINGRQKNGKSITLVPKSFIEWLMDTCEPGEEKEVDGVIYVGVTQVSVVMGVIWITILNNLKKVDGVKSMQGKQKKGQNVTLVPKSFIEWLMDTCEPGEEKEVDGVIYVGVTQQNEVMEVSWNYILRNLKKADGVKSINGRQKNGKSITLVPKSFIEWLMDTCEPGEEKEVDGVIYVGVISANKVSWVRWQTILENFKNAEQNLKFKSIPRKQSNLRPITLIPKSFIEWLIEDAYKSGEEKEVDGVIYVEVTNTNEVMGVRWQTILRNLKKVEGVKIINERQKNGQNITLVPKSFIEGLKK